MRTAAIRAQLSQSWQKKFFLLKNLFVVRTSTIRYAWVSSSFAQRQATPAPLPPTVEELPVLPVPGGGGFS